MIQKFIAVSLFVILLSCPAVADITEMTCKNPRQDYSVTFDDVVRTFLVGAPGADTPYMVESVEKGEDGLVVRGKTVKDGPGFAAYFGGKMRVEFIDGGQVIQTDACK